MDVKRFTAFVLISVLLLAGIGFTSPLVLKNVRLGLDLKGGFEILYQASPLEEGQAVTPEALKETARSLEHRVNEQGIAEPEITTEGKDRIRVRIAGVTDPDKVRDMLKKPAELTFRGPDGTKEMIGSDFSPGGAKLGYDSYNRPMVNIQVKDDKKDKFKEVTTKLRGKPLAIYLDEKELSAPVVNDVIANGVATISGSYTYDEAKEIRDTINLGALPLKLSEKYTQQIDATLGAASLKDTMMASTIALVLILLFMLFYYRVPGIVAVITLILYTWMLLGVFALMNATMTLPGIAAFVLGIGMAVDANIITAERIKEELRSGKSIMSAFRSGSKHSFRTIIDAHVTTFLAGIVLYFLGTGSIQGFALTLIFSIITGLFTNVFISRILLQLLLRSNVVKKPESFGVKGDEIHAL